MSVLSIAVDIFLVIVFAVFLILITRKGFILTMYRIGKTWLSFFCSVVLGPWVAGGLEDLFLRRLITGGVYNSLVGMVEGNANGYNLVELFERLPDGFVNILNRMGISLAELQAQYGSYAEAGDEIMRGMAEQIATPCIHLVSGIIGYAVCFLVTQLFFLWLRWEAKKRRIAFFRVLDYITGFLLGAVIGYCAVLGLSVLTHTIFQVVVAFDANSGVVAVYENSYLFKFLSRFDTVGALKKVVQTVL